MPTNIKCPKCSFEFPIEDAVSEEYKKELREQMVNFKKQKEEELYKKEQEWKQQLQQQERELLLKNETEKKQLQKDLEENLRKKIIGDFENQLTLLQQNNAETEEKLKEARKKELEYYQKEQALKTREEELEIQMQKRMQQEREKLAEEIRRLEYQKTEARDMEHQLRMKELEKQLEDQKKLVDEMKRKAEQGSMQLQGEVQELALEELLKASFPFDVITEVGKGSRGADCIQAVRNNFGQECGKIIYESKRAQNFSVEWIEKLKKDMRSQGADIAVIVTRIMPKEMECFGLKDGIWICSFGEVKALASVLRDGVIRVYNSAASQQNKGDKMHLLYDYLISNEFAEQWSAIREGFQSMKMSIQRERDAMERLWKAREKQLEKVLLNAAHIRGSIEGIAGSNSIDLHLLEDADMNEEEND
ncbi:MAG: DUF2130 domain-containing protein [Chitinophagaceae bacterium]|nr:DUF2130 domain-containing protein [Chitinophagaceae bacterium]